MLDPQLLSQYCDTAIMAVHLDSETIIAANPASETLLGYPLAQLIGMKIADIEVGLQDVFFWEDVRQCGAQEVLHVESEYRHQNGQFLPVSKTIRVVQQAEGVICIISASNIGASKRLEEESARSSSLLAATLESTVDGILVTDLDGRIINFNHRLTQIWPWQIQTEAKISTLLLEFKTQLQEREQFADWLTDLYHDPYLEDKFTCSLLDGRVYEIATCPQQYRDAPIGRVFSVHDISELKATEAALRIARDQAQTANKAKSDFLAHMSHELRTPLNAIMGFAQVIEADDEGQHQILGSYIHKAGQHLLGLINEVLDLASIEAGKLALRLESINVAEVIHDCIELTQFLAKDKGITIAAQPIAANCFIQADQRRFKQMLLNLISNAIKYNRPAGKVTLFVTQEQAGHWRITVSDTGVGISEQDQRKLFTPFNRVGDAQTQIEGTGIGLAFTRKLALLMKGQVGLSSEVNVGSQFWIDLPAALAPDSAIVALHTPSAITTDTRTILYIEDDLLSQKLIQNILAKQRPQYQIFVAKTGQEGLALAHQLVPDLILLDQQLPDATGAMIYEQLQLNERTCNTPCIALSGNTLPEQINDALRTGFSAYLSKPVQISQALLTIDQVLSQGKHIPR
ncbi:response regulator [Chitinibacter bivalviorum]|uniref:histidine kinase n=1 Tax=Chitinibacter bivalviorum TaxID=2739434 RepID=A0A7H9BH91_9NEIS|nr:PAS domain-containing hybrid sensor histidine kinase/response regulator [Chitinibacter bivalviorum]QLG86904.1 response regulator [Chitinibacter bivalviorum]